MERAAEPCGAEVLIVPTRTAPDRRPAHPEHRRNVDIRSEATVEPILEHETVKVHSLFPKFSFREQTEGSYLEFVDVFEIRAGAQAEPHYHDTHEFYFLLEGDAVVQIEDEASHVRPGDLIHIPRNAKHSIWPTTDRGVKAFCFAVSYQEPELPGYTPAELPPVEPAAQ